MDQNQSFSTYSFKGKKGIDDLENSFKGDLVTEWWSQADWDKWNRDAPNRARRDAEYIEALKACGEFGKEYTVNMHVKHNPIFDTPQKAKETPFESYRVIFIDDK